MAYEFEWPLDCLLGGGRSIDFSECCFFPLFDSIIIVGLCRLIGQGPRATISVADALGSPGSARGEACQKSRSISTDMPRSWLFSVVETSTCGRFAMPSGSRCWRGMVRSAWKGK